MQVLDVAIALLERRSALEAVAQHSLHADSAPSEADAKLEAQVCLHVSDVD